MVSLLSVGLGTRRTDSVLGCSLWFLTAEETCLVLQWKCKRCVPHYLYTVSVLPLEWEEKVKGSGGTGADVHTASRP